MSYQSIAKVNDDLSVEHVRTQDTAPILKSIEQARQVEQRGELRFAARIPLAVLGGIQKKIGIVNEFGQPKFQAMTKDDLKRLYKELNSNEYNRLRIWEGKL